MAHCCSCSVGHQRSRSQIATALPQGEAPRQDWGVLHAVLNLPLACPGHALPPCLHGGSCPRAVRATLLPPLQQLTVRAKQGGGAGDAANEDEAELKQGWKFGRNEGDMGW